MNQICRDHTESMIWWEGEGAKSHMDLDKNVAHIFNIVLSKKMLSAIGIIRKRGIATAVLTHGATSGHTETHRCGLTTFFRHSS